MIEQMRQEYSEKLIYATAMGLIAYLVGDYAQERDWVRRGHVYLDILDMIDGLNWPES